MSLHTTPVSVVIPVWNVDPDYFRSCIDSVENQTYNTDLIDLSVCDDGSTGGKSDQYRDILEGEVTVNYTWTRHRDNLGVSHARNAAVANSVGEIIVPLDADDVLHPRAIEFIVERFKCTPGLDMVYSNNVKFTYPSLNLFQYRKKEIYQKNLRRYKNTAYDPLLQSSFVVGVQGYRRTAFEEIGGYDESIEVAEDIDFLLKIHGLSSSMNFGHVPFVLYYRRHIPDSLSRLKQTEMQNTTERLFLKRARELNIEVSSIDYLGRIQPYGVSHYAFRNLDGDIIVPPYIDPAKKQISHVWDTPATLHNQWREHHRNTLRQILQQ